jgi:high-affinity nickel-transport protein
VTTQIAKPPASRSDLTRREWGRLSGMALVIVLLNGGGWGVFAFAIAPHHFQFRGLGLGLGVALTAWTLGARHAFDADHISAIDNTTRKLMADGRRPLGTGFFFALGHSSIIIAVGAGLAVAARAVFGAVVDPSSGFETLGGVIGTSMAATFLYLIAALNLVVLAGILKVFRGMRRGLFDEEELERQLQARGLMYRFFGRFMRSITQTWHMFFVGVVFGIGFDTATEVLLLAATAAAATEGLPWYAVVSLPLLFAGGMTLFDTADGCFMNFAYGWAFARPVRKVYYNLVITGLSIAVAFFIGTIEILGLLSAELHIHGGFWDFMANFNINQAGFGIAALFAIVWALALAYWKIGKVEAAWTTSPGAASPSPSPSPSCAPAPSPSGAPHLAAGPPRRLPR